jgi:hypothetical protein
VRVNVLRNERVVELKHIKLHRPGIENMMSRSVSDDDDEDDSNDEGISVATKTASIARNSPPRPIHSLVCTAAKLKTSQLYTAAGLNLKIFKF